MHIRCHIASVGDIELSAKVWKAMRDIAKRERRSLNEVFAYINDAKPKDKTLAESLSQFPELYFSALAAEAAREQ